MLALAHSGCARRSASKSLCREPLLPEISRFLGIVIRMYYLEHAPPHFHARYGDHEVSVEIASRRVVGDFPRRALRHVLESLDIHRFELLEDWKLAAARLPLRQIPPLE
jgi:hypothetical protein